MNSSSTTPMSSVPVQLLIYVMDTPTCGLAPIILPLSRCMEVQVGVTISFNISALTRCDPAVSDIDSMIFPLSIYEMNTTDIIKSATNASISYTTFTWQPSSDQLGSNRLCLAAVSE